MTQHIIGYFCGTDYTRASDANLATITDLKTESTELLSYDGCQVHGGGTFAFGVEEQADAFIADLKRLDLSDPAIQLNLVAHSRGVLSALIVIKKIQADPDLKDKIQITADFHDPVPGNFQLTTVFASNLAIANQLHDLSAYEIVKKVYITLQEKPISPVAFDALVPKFHHATTVDIETLPGFHDVQHREEIIPNAESPVLLTLGKYKTLSLLRADGHQLQQWELQNEEFDAYENLLLWAQGRELPFGERDLLFGGKIIANNGEKTRIDAINWRHAQLKKIRDPEFVPEHVLYGTRQPNYNYQKSQLERYCDLSIALDDFLANYPDQQDLVNSIKDASKQYLNETFNSQDYRENCQHLLGQTWDKNLNRAINSMCLNAYLQELDQAIAENVEADTTLYEKLQGLRVALLQELDSLIQNGQSIAQIENSNPIKIANNTIIFLNNIYAGDVKAQDIIALSEQYANDNVRFGRNWNLGSKVIIGALLSLAATVVGCALGAIIGFTIAFALTGGETFFITTGVALFLGAISGAVLGISAGVGASYYFFSPSPAEKRIQALAKDLIDSQTAASVDDIAGDFAILV